MLSKLAVRRLTKLCDFMESLPRSANKHFDMAAFIKQPSGSAKEISEKPKAAELHACGTTACALGWAVTSPTFRRYGLRLNKWESGDWGISFAGYEVNGEKDAFDIAPYEQEWDDLFGGDNKDKTPKAWAKRVRKYIKDNA